MRATPGGPSFRVFTAELVEPATVVTTYPGIVIFIILHPFAPQIHALEPVESISIPPGYKNLAAEPVPSD